MEQSSKTIENDERYHFGLIEKSNVSKVLSDDDNYLDVDHTEDFKEAKGDELNPKIEEINIKSLVPQVVFWNDYIAILNSERDISKSENKLETNFSNENRSENANTIKIEESSTKLSTRAFENFVVLKFEAQSKALNNNNQVSESQEQYLNVPESIEEKSKKEIIFHTVLETKEVSIQVDTVDFNSNVDIAVQTIENLSNSKEDKDQLITPQTNLSPSDQPISMQNEKEIDHFSASKDTERAFEEKENQNEKGAQQSNKLLKETREETETSEALLESKRIIEELSNLLVKTKHSLALESSRRDELQIRVNRKARVIESWLKELFRNLGLPQDEKLTGIIDFSH